MSDQVEKLKDKLNASIGLLRPIRLLELLCSLLLIAIIVGFMVTSDFSSDKFLAWWSVSLPIKEIRVWLTTTTLITGLVFFMINAYRLKAFDFFKEHLVEITDEVEKLPELKGDENENLIVKTELTKKIGVYDNLSEPFCMEGKSAIALNLLFGGLCAFLPAAFLLYDFIKN